MLLIAWMHNAASNYSLHPSSSGPRWNNESSVTWCVFPVLLIDVWRSAISCHPTWHAQPRALKCFYLCQGTHWHQCILQILCLTLYTCLQHLSQTKLNASPNCKRPAVHWNCARQWQLAQTTPATCQPYSIFTHRFTDQHYYNLLLFR